MDIEFTEEKRFSQEDVESLYLSVGWISGQYPTRLYKALQNSSTVLTAWDGSKLVGLLRALDDGGMLAYIHYVLVRPDYQGHGIAGTLVKKIKEKYRDYMYIEVMPEESRNAAFYEKFGFKRMQDAAALQIVNLNISK